MRRLNKRGASDNPIYPIVIFLVLNTAYFFTLFLFINKHSTGASLYEEIYAKQIELSIDSAKPGIEIWIDIKKGLEIAKENNFNGEIILFDNSNNINVSFSDGGKYSLKHFSNLKISSTLDNSSGILKLRFDK